jgi:hypothetical protein
MGNVYTIVLAALSSVLDNTFDLLASTALIGTTVYWLFYLGSTTLVAHSGSNPDDVNVKLNAHLLRARTAARVVNVGIIIVAMTRLLGDTGLHVDQIVQIGSVLSIGVSWSLRDSLASLWASLLMSLTTDINEGTIFRFQGNWYVVRKRGASFVECDWVVPVIGGNHEVHYITDPVVKEVARQNYHDLDITPLGTSSSFWYSVSGGRSSYVQCIPSTSLLAAGYTVVRGVRFTQGARVCK